MARFLSLIYIFVMTFLEGINRTHMSFHDNEFIQSTNEVRYFVDDISTMHKEFSSAGVNIPDFDDAKMYNSRMFLKFDPDILDFKQRHIGVPHHEKVTIINTDNNKTLVMSSISGNTVHFHSSFFEDKVIPPLGNTTFNVVFLGRQEGLVESVLLIHTSEGSIKYKVKAMGETNPYRLRPLVGIRLPLNASFSPLIYMHNPHSSAIQVTEVYSSGGDFHLELPSGEPEGPKQMWEIPPYQTRPIIRVKFNARVEANHTAYVRIKLNNSQDVFIIPLEVEVCPYPGLYVPQGGLDFGIGGSLDQPQKIKLLLFNTWKKPIRIDHISTDVDSDILSIDFQQVKIQPNQKNPTHVATLTINWKSAFSSYSLAGKLQIHSKQVPYNIIVPYWATFIEGGLVFDSAVTQYLLGKNTLDVADRKFTVVNSYEVPLAITNITLTEEASSYFTIEEFSNIVILPKQNVTLFVLHPKSSSTLYNLKIESFITIQTNVSSIKIPLVTYDGKLKKIIPFSTDTVLDFGLVGMDVNKHIHFFLVNNNPTDVTLQSWTTDLKSANVKILRCSTENVTFDYKFDDPKPCSVLKPGEFATFSVNILTPNSEGQFWGEVMVETQFESITIPIKVKTASGALEIDHTLLNFGECFPGRKCSHPLKIHSTFGYGMNIVGITSIPPNPSLTYSLDVADIPHVAAKTPKEIGRLHLNLQSTCAPFCYTGLILNSTIGAQWLHSFSLSFPIHELDISLLTSRYEKYINMTSNGLSQLQNLTLRLDTTEVKGHIFSTKVKMGWPKLSATKNVFNFPLTQIGNVTYQTIKFNNPSSSDLILHLVMDWMYPKILNLYEDLPELFIPDCKECPLASPTTFYFNPIHNDSRDSFRSKYNVFLHKDSLPIIIPPGEQTEVSIGFKASVSGLRTALLFVRNNLTIIEVIRLIGQGANPVLKFGNRKPGSPMPLLFELTDKHLKDCEKEKTRKNPSPNLTVKRSFTARNTGDISISINQFYINEYLCEGFGFKILNCEPFILAPNATRKIDIAFTPDFTLAKIHRTLIILTSLNSPVNYTLVTTVPPYFLATCSNVLARPLFEPFLYYTSLSAMTFLLFCVLIAAFLESNRIIRSTVVACRDVFPLQAPLDLRLVGTQTRNEIRSQKLENEWSKPLLPQNGVHLNNSSQETDKKVKESVSDSNFTNKTWTADLETNSLPKNQKTILTTNKVETGNLYSSNVTPAVSNKSKKKPGKRSSNGADENSMEIVQEPVHNKKNVLSKSQAKVKNNNQSVIVESREVKQEKTVEVQKDKRYASKKNKHIPNCEEETSSTTTESSNNDDVEKENTLNTEIKQDKNKKGAAKKTKSSMNEYRDNCDADGEDEEYEKVSKKTVVQDNKVSPKIHNDTVKNNVETAKQQESDAVLKNRNNRNNSNRERKEKNSQKKQRASERNSNIKVVNCPQDTIKSNNVTRISSISPPSNCWGENRASFSDVVARSDTNIVASNKSAVKRQEANLQPSLPSVFNTDLPKEPDFDFSNSIETNNVELGPIGTKKSPVNTWESIPESIPVKPRFVTNQQQLAAAADSLFMNGFVDQVPMMPPVNNPHLGPLVPGPERWEQQSLMSLMNMMQNSNARNYLGDSMYYNNNWTSNTNSVWGNSVYTSPAVGEERQNAHNLMSGLNNTSTVWDASPWTLRTPGTPTRTPPGFHARPPVQQEEEQNHVVGFDPFQSTFGNIWSPSRPPNP